MATTDLHDKIAERMFASAIIASKKNPFHAGYTYLGQFVSHDIVPSTMQRTMSRRVSGYMNLDSVYGTAPLYDYKFQPQSIPFFEKTGEFKLNQSVAHDLPRKPTGNKYVAIIPEVRNDENQIIAQFHLLLMKLHNALLTRGFARDALEARMYTTLLFQLVVIEDFLEKVLTKKVHDAIFNQNRFSIEKQLLTEYSPVNSSCFIPTVFSHATWRFGHSNILPNYHLNNTGEAPVLSTLLQAGSPIAETRMVHWPKFFDFGTDFSPPQLAARTDTLITRAMQGLGGTYFKQNIVTLNLSAAERMDLPAGNDFIEQLNSIVPNWATISGTLGIKHRTSLTNTRFDKIQGLTVANLPLWLFVLLEAETNSQSLGERLGPLGSLINASVIKHSIKGADFSVYSGQRYSYSDALKKLGKLAGEPFIKNKNVSMANLITFINED